MGKFYSSYDPRKQRASLVGKDSDLADTTPLLSEMLRYLSSVAQTAEVEEEGASVVVKRDENGYMLPDKAQNNTFDFDAAQKLFHGLQEEGIPMTVVTRWAAYAAKLPPELKGSIGEGPNHSNHSNSFKIGIFLRKFQFLISDFNF